jgi:hypothetical protein
VARRETGLLSQKSSVFGWLSRTYTTSFPCETFTLQMKLSGSKRGDRFWRILFLELSAFIADIVRIEFGSTLARERLL